MAKVPLTRRAVKTTGKRKAPQAVSVKVRPKRATIDATYKAAEPIGSEEVADERTDV